MTATKTFFTVEPAMLTRYDQLSRQHGLHAQKADELRAWQADLRLRLRAVTGIDTMQTCPLAPEAGPVEACDGYTRQRIVIAVEPGLRMPFYVLVPADIHSGERRPVVIAPHGHGGGGKESVAGRRDLPHIAEAIDQYQYDYGVQLARVGFVALCPDARGFGERRERGVQGNDRDSVLASSCRAINNMAIPLGQTVTGMWTWDLMRLIDYAATRDDCDMTRLGCVGLSGGGLQTLWLTALDERVRVAVVSGYFYGYKDSLLHLHDNCSCNYVPGLWQLADMGDLGALIAPRPLLIESGLRDHLNGPRGIANVVDQLAITQQAYQLLGTENQLVHSTFDGPHRWHGEEALPWLREKLGLERKI